MSTAHYSQQPRDSSNPNKCPLVNKMWYIQGRISFKREGNPDACYSTDEPWASKEMYHLE
jgi:hypothetical protein